MAQALMLYRYLGVPSRIYWDLLDAQSKGAYFNNVTSANLASHGLRTTGP